MHYHNAMLHITGQFRRAGMPAIGCSSLARREIVSCLSSFSIPKTRIRCAFYVARRPAWDKAISRVCFFLQQISRPVGIVGRGALLRTTSQAGRLRFLFSKEKSLCGECGMSEYAGNARENPEEKFGLDIDNGREYWYDIIN